MTLAYGAPFSTPGLVVLDLLRLATVLVGLLVVGSMAVSWDRVSAGRRLGHVGVALVVLTVAGSRIQNLGQPPTWQLVTGALGIVALGWVTFRHGQDKGT